MCIEFERRKRLAEKGVKMSRLRHGVAGGLVMVTLVLTALARTA
jgi:hypothetical protein